VPDQARRFPFKAQAGRKRRVQRDDRGRPVLAGLLKTADGRTLCPIRRGVSRSRRRPAENGGCNATMGVPLSAP